MHRDRKSDITTKKKKMFTYLTALADMTKTVDR